MTRCLTSGQVFRWLPTVDGGWSGVDGEGWYVVREVEPGTWEVETNRGEEAFSRFVRLDWDGASVEREIVERGPELEPYMAALRGLRLLRPESASEVFFTFLCTPNNHIQRIGPMVRKLAAYGEPFGDRTEFTRFPTVARVAAIDPSDLRRQGFGYRAETIPAAAQFVLEQGGEAWLDTLRREPYEVAHEELLRVPNVGRKLADCICLFGLDHPDVVPLDTHMWQVLTRLYFPNWHDTALTDAKYRTVRHHFRKRFGSLTGWAQQALFVDNVTHWRARKKPV